MAPRRASLAAGGSAIRLCRGEERRRAPRPRGARRNGPEAPPVPQHKAPTTRVTLQSSARWARIFSLVQARVDARGASPLQVEGRVEDRDDVAGDPDALARLAQQATRAAHRDALLDLEPDHAGAGVQV